MLHVLIIAGALRSEKQQVVENSTSMSSIQHVSRYHNRIQSSIPQKYYIKYTVTFLAWILLTIFVSDKE